MLIQSIIDRLATANPIILISLAITICVLIVCITLIIVAAFRGPRVIVDNQVAQPLPEPKLSQEDRDFIASIAERTFEQAKTCNELIVKRSNTEEMANAIMLTFIAADGRKSVSRNVSTAGPFIELLKYECNKNQWGSSDLKDSLQLQAPRARRKLPSQNAA